ncbi:single-stranded DNA-binding protein [Campylobacter concisus]|uniref:single-stranded DNA-binding protein n=1 Tax=Campylobacter concisus TaxID=199 RepID=UPI00122D0B0C|nr:single-stranded DNA-binding protein [Campylobacter concisus]
MFNKVVLVGNLTRDIELRYTTSGSAIGNSGIAVTRKFNTNGEKREETCFIDISFFGKSAEIANQYLSKGSKLLVEGRLKFDQWTDNNGQNRSKHSIVVENMEMLGGNSGANGQSQGGFNQNSSYSQQRNNGSNNSYGNGGYQNSAPQKQQMQPQNKKIQEEHYEEKIPDINIDADNFDGDNEIPF